MGRPYLQYVNCSTFFGGGVHDTLKLQKLHSFALLKKIEKHEEFT